jgi:hypothetical protein
MRTYFFGIYTTTTTKHFIPKQVRDRLEMKPHKPKKEKEKRGIKQERKRRKKQRVIKNQIKKRKDNKTLSQKNKKGVEKNLTKVNKRKELKIKILAYELLASTLSYLMLAP